MQFRDLQKQYEVLKPEMDAAMIAVASGAHFISGEQVKTLEERLAAFRLLLYLDIRDCCIIVCRFFRNNCQTKKIFDLPNKNRNGNTGCKTCRDRIRNIFNQGTKMAEAHNT